MDIPVRAGRDESKDSHTDKSVVERFYDDIREGASGAKRAALSFCENHPYEVAAGVAVTALLIGKSRTIGRGLGLTAEGTTSATLNSATQVGSVRAALSAAPRLTIRPVVAESATLQAASRAIVADGAAASAAPSRVRILGERAAAPAVPTESRVRILTDGAPPPTAPSEPRIRILGDRATPPTAPSESRIRILGDRATPPTAPAESRIRILGDRATPPTAPSESQIRILGNSSGAVPTEGTISQGLLRDVEPIRENWGLVPSTRAELAAVVERPLLPACELLYDRNIRTLSSTANAAAILEGKVGLSIDYDLLSEANKRIGAQLGRIHPLYNKTSLEISIPVSATTTVSEVQRSANAIAMRFERQPLNWGFETWPEFKRAYYPSAASPAEFINTQGFRSLGYTYDPANNRFFRSRELYLKSLGS